MSDQETIQTGWQFPKSPNNEGVFSFQQGISEILLRRHGNEVQLADRPADSDKELSWCRWTTRHENADVIVQPRLPELPILCEPESKFSVMPSSRTRVFIEIPLRIAVLSPPVLLSELPTETLSHTWFGELHTGELCYWISTGALIQPPENVPSNRAIAPVLIENKSEENLEVSRICLRTFGLRLYSENNQLWTSETEIRYVGGYDVSKVTIRSGAPPEAKLATLISPARASTDPGLVARTFRSLREWTMID